MRVATRPAPGAPGPRPVRARTGLAALAASAAAHLLLLAWLARFPLPGPRPPGGPITIALIEAPPPAPPGFSDLRVPLDRRIWKKVRLVAVG